MQICYAMTQKVSTDGKLTGDPTETALVDMAFKLSFDPSIYERIPRVQEIPFDSERKLMTTVNKVNDKFIVYTKGGIDELLEKCSSYQISGEIKQDTQSFKKIPFNNRKRKRKNGKRSITRIRMCI